MGVIFGDQAQRRAGGLELAVFVIDQQGFLISQCRCNPAVRRSATQELMNFRKIHAHTPKHWELHGRPAVI